MKVYKYQPLANLILKAWVSTRESQIPQVLLILEHFAIKVLSDIKKKTPSKTVTIFSKYFTSGEFFARKFIWLSSSNLIIQDIVFTLFTPSRWTNCSEQEWSFHLELYSLTSIISHTNIKKSFDRKWM